MGLSVKFGVNEGGFFYDQNELQVLFLGDVAYLSHLNVEDLKGGAKNLPILF